MTHRAPAFIILDTGLELEERAAIRERLVSLVQQLSPGAGTTPLRKRLREAGHLLFTSFARALERVAPGLNDLLAKVIEVANQVEQETMVARQEILTMRVDETEFQLCAVAGHHLAHSDYLPLAERGEVYEPVATLCLTRLLQELPDPVFMDIGAFIGYFSCYAAALQRDERPVFAVESNPRFSDAIEQAVALNGFERLRVLREALADHSTAVTIDDTAVLSTSEPGPGRRTVQAISLDDLCARERIAPTVLKIDVHGAEGNVIRGMSRVCRESVEIVLLELHALHFYKPYSPGITRLELLDLLEEYGFSLYYVAGHRWERNSGISAYLEEGRFAYVPLTRETRQFLLFDRPMDVLILASKAADLAALLGPAVDICTAIG